MAPYSKREREVGTSIATNLLSGDSFEEFKAETAQKTTDVTPDVEQTAPTEPPMGNTPQLKLAREKKSKHVHILLKPSIFDAMKDIAEKESISVNELYNHAVETFLKEYRKEA